MGTKKFRREDAIELTEANVISIYNACLATKDTPAGNITNAKFSDNPHVPIVHFDWKLINYTYLEKLKFLLGQLLYVHNFNPDDPYALIFKSSTGAVNYKGQPWTKNSKILGLFYYLEECCLNITPFNDDNICYLEEYAHIIPTLSPNDPAFSAWAKEHIE